MSQLAVCMHEVCFYPGQELASAFDNAESLFFCAVLRGRLDVTMSTGATRDGTVRPTQWLPQHAPLNSVLRAAPGYRHAVERRLLWGGTRLACLQSSQTWLAASNKLHRGRRDLRASEPWASLRTQGSWLRKLQIARSGSSTTSGVHCLVVDPALVAAVIAAAPAGATPATREPHSPSELKVRPAAASNAGPAVSTSTVASTRASDNDQRADEHNDTESKEACEATLGAHWFKRVRLIGKGRYGHVWLAKVTPPRPGWPLFVALKVMMNSDVRCARVGLWCCRGV